LKRVDVFVTPVSIAAPTIEEAKQGFALVDGRTIKFQDTRGSYWGLSTIPFNVTGLPAVSVCCGFTSSGLPIGLQIAGGYFQESTVLRVAHAYEQAAGFHLRKPALA
jgi:Asp-tRNA(Asn)/Glu-tRNA(Gln) amidotransferase A subunit family amidase